MDIGVVALQFLDELEVKYKDLHGPQSEVGCQNSSIQVWDEEMKRQKQAVGQWNQLFDSSRQEWDFRGQLSKIVPNQ